jgi:hypothetical protein
LWLSTEVLGTFLGRLKGAAQAARMIGVLVSIL